METDDGVGAEAEAALDRDIPLDQAGFIKFYGLYWNKHEVIWNKNLLLGQPSGWMGKGKTAKNFDKLTVQMNFWAQKGVYILYDDNLQPVYAGQAGLTRKNTNEGQTIGNRLQAHTRGVYRNGWTLFSWFGFLSTQKLNLKQCEEKKRMEPKWAFNPSGENSLNDLLASFEAIVIEGFSPRFNARGGDLGKAILVDQYDQPDE